MIQRGRSRWRALRTSYALQRKRTLMFFSRKYTDFNIACFYGLFSLNFNQEHLPAVGFLIPLSSCGGSLFISVLLRKVVLHRAKELLLLLDVLLLSPSACLPVKPKSKTISQKHAKNSRNPTCRVVLAYQNYLLRTTVSLLQGFVQLPAILMEINIHSTAQLGHMHSQQVLKKSSVKLTIRDYWLKANYRAIAKITKTKATLTRCRLHVCPIYFQWC